MNEIKFRVLKGLIFSLVLMSNVWGQSGISVSPPKTYFTLNENEVERKKIRVTNLSIKDTLDLSVSFNDWIYDEFGSNIIADPNSLPNSCSDWITVFPSSVFSLGPKEEIELEIQMNVPKELTVDPVHTTMMFITQTNSFDKKNTEGQNIRVSFQTGVKVYQRLNVGSNLDIDFTNFEYIKKDNSLILQLQNIGNIWADGLLENELFNQDTGEQIKLENQVFYSLPGDHRSIKINLPKDLPKGNYIITSTFNLGEKDLIKIAELNFTYE